MALNHYTAVIAAINDWHARSDLTTVAADFITLAEERIYSEMRVRHMETAYSTAIASGVVAVPSGYLELKFAYISGSPAQWLDQKAPQWIYQQFPTRSSEAKPEYVARDGSNFIFGPYPDSGYTFVANYYKRLDGLSTASGTNWLTNSAPDLILFGALVESSPYLGDDGRAGMWEARFQEAKRRIQLQHDSERFPREMGLRTTTA